ncbi:MAG: DUF2779 domain-containing protein [Verrucomicrobia bacterium]|nr:DUF2779 domain-containing protein [Verrucomicrobiota bacterium]
MRTLSKSKIIAFRQCPKRLWLDLHKPELCDDSASETVFKIGNQVGDIARTIYDSEGTGVLIDIKALGHGEALTRSAKLLAEGHSPVFEAGLKTEGALAYADVMLPDRSDDTLRWRMVEVKSSTSVKEYHHDDIAVQSHIAVSSGVRLSSVSLAHINTSFIYQGDSDYRGLLQEADLTEEALSRGDEVKQWIADAQVVAAMAEEPEVATGPHCTKPFTCGFCDYCNRDKVLPEFPLGSLPKLHIRKREQFESEGYADLRDVPDELLNAVQRRVKQCSVTGDAFFDADGAAADLSPFGFPAYFLDFETILFAVPIWKGTRPYQQITFQFSLHTLAKSGQLAQTAFLDLSGNDPSEPFAKALISACGKKGPVFVYNATFETSRIRELAERFPDLADSLLAINARVVDLLPIARNRYYHPSQQGSWSIKAVLPAVAPELNYDNLTGVQDGGMAQEVFREAIQDETSAERKREIEQQLLAYCRLDTFAMVRLWQFFSGRDEPALQDVD